MTRVPTCEYSLPLTLAMNRLNGKRPRRSGRRPVRKRMSPVLSDLAAPLVPLLHDRRVDDRRELRRTSARRSRRAPRGCPCHPAGISRSVGSLPSIRSPVDTPALNQSKTLMGIFLETRAGCVASLADGQTSGRDRGRPIGGNQWWDDKRTGRLGVGDAFLGSGASLATAGASISIRNPVGPIATKVIWPNSPEWSQGGNGARFRRRIPTCPGWMGGDGRPDRVDPAFFPEFLQDRGSTGRWIFDR